MYRFTRHVAIAALLSGTLSGCGDFLQGPSVDQDPNNPTTLAVNADVIFAGFQSQQFAAFTNPLTVSICGWVQQCSATNGRFVEDQLMQYNINPTTFDGSFEQIYGQGGLKDIRVAQEKLAAKPTPDLVYSGILRVWEALIMSSAADKWGAIPYSEAAGTVATPALDPQTTVYTTTTALLDQAIGELGTAGAGPGPGAVDYVFQGDPAAWLAMAHTLKARLLLHQVRASCAFSTAAGSCAAYAPIITEAQQGIQIGGRDFTTVTSGASALESNGWWQFYNLSGFGFPDLRGGRYLDSVMTARADPRLASYFEDSGDTEGPFISRSRNIANFSQPWITGRENALILAEALFYTGDVAGATAQVNAVRASIPFAALGGPVTIDSIITEKYIELFQNPEAWNDYKRLCLPALTPTETAGAGPIPTLIPRRVFYGQTESDINKNIPDATTQVVGGGPNLPAFRNTNDPPPPQGCTPIAH